jgi:hypothetical protein
LPAAGLTVQPCPLSPITGVDLKKPWDVDCILKIFCNGDSEDKSVVGKLPRLTVHKREPKQVHFKRFVGGTWVDDGFPSGGSASGTTVSINADKSCAEAASTLYHEVAHTDQPAGMPGSQKEYDAHIKTEQWRIKKGLPPKRAGYRKKVKDPKDPSKEIEVPDEAKIKELVDKNYAYNPPTPLGGGPAPPPVVSISPDGKQVTLADGTKRAPKENDALRLPDTGGKTIETIDATKWKCP